MGYFATYRPGGTLVNLWYTNGQGAGSYNCAPIIAPSALGPRNFCFYTENGVFCIDAETGSTWSL